MANSLEVIGRLHVISDTQQVNDTFRKRDFVIEIQDGNYPQHIKVLFNLRGRPYQSKTGETAYFTNLEAWRVEPMGVATGATDYSGVRQAANTAASVDFDDVPF